jgi:hypothetical protein
VYFVPDFSLLVDPLANVKGLLRGHSINQRFVAISIRFINCITNLGVLEQHCQETNSKYNERSSVDVTRTRLVDVIRGRVRAGWIGAGTVRTRSARQNNALACQIRGISGGCVSG